MCDAASSHQRAKEFNQEFIMWFQLLMNSFLFFFLNMEGFALRSFSDEETFTGYGPQENTFYYIFLSML